jgi:multicomponent Na+:H+ antiporter subunit G
MIVRDVIASVFLLAGALFCLIGALGLLRFPDPPTRLQAATKPQTIGLLLILTGVAVRVEPTYATGVALVAVFQVFTAPVLSQLLGRAAYRTGAFKTSSLVVDELDERLRAEHDGSSTG